MYLEPQRRQVLRPGHHLERRPNPRAGADRHFRADILPLAELALHRRTHAGGQSSAEADRLESARDYRRSEEHTSELQSLMRISYAVFCLKKKTLTKKNRTNNTYRKEVNNKMIQQQS